MAENMSLKRKRSLKAQESGKGTEIYSADRSTRWRNLGVVFLTLRHSKKVSLCHAPDSVEDSYRSEDESGASDDEYVSEFNNKNINHIVCIRTRVIVSLLKT